MGFLASTPNHAGADSQFTIEVSAPVVVEPPKSVEALISSVAADVGVSSTTLYNLAYSESKLNPDAVGDGGKSFGLTQIHLDYSKVTKEEALDPEFNLRFAAKAIAEDRAYLWTSCNCYSYAKVKVGKLPKMAQISPNSSGVVGALALFTYQGVRHVAVVTAIHGATFTVSEANYKPCVIGTREVAFTDKNLVGFFINR